MIKPDGTRVAFVYDNLQRLISAGVAGAAETRRTYSYGAFSTVGNLTNAASAAGTANAVTQRFTYDFPRPDDRRQPGRQCAGRHTGLTTPMTSLAAAP